VQKYLHDQHSSPRKYLLSQEKDKNNWQFSSEKKKMPPLPFEVDFFPAELCDPMLTNNFFNEPCDF
jgi:hypothetical protein